MNEIQRTILKILREFRKERGENAFISIKELTQKVNDRLSQNLEEDILVIYMLLPQLADRVKLLTVGSGLHYGIWAVRLRKKGEKESSEKLDMADFFKIADELKGQKLKEFLKGLINKISPDVKLEDIEDHIKKVKLILSKGEREEELNLDVNKIVFAKVWEGYLDKELKEKIKNIFSKPIGFHKGEKNEI